MIQKTFSIILLSFIVTGSGLFFVMPKALAQFKNTPPQLQVKKDGSQTLINKFEDPKPVKCPAGYPAPYDKGEQCVAITWIADYIVALYRWLVSIVGILAVAMGVWAGIKWMAAAGNPEQINSAKEQIMNAVIGILLLLGSYVFLNTINPSLTKLKGVIIPGVLHVETGGKPCAGEKDSWCGKRVNPTTGTVCFSPYSGDFAGSEVVRTTQSGSVEYRYPIGSTKYENCCTTSSADTVSAKVLATDCCIGTQCNNDEVCIPQGDAYRCIKGKDGIHGTVPCDANQSGQFIDSALQLWVACIDNRVILTQPLTCTDTAIPNDGKSFCTACTNNNHTYLFSKEVLNRAKSDCGSAATVKGYFFAVQLNKEIGIISNTSRVYYAGSNGPLTNDAWPSLKWTAYGATLNDQQKKDYLGNVNLDALPLLNRENLVKTGLPLPALNNRQGKWAP